MNYTYDIDSDHELYVETAKEWQILECPGCGNEFRELIRTIDLGAVTCPECNDEIRFRFERETPDRDQPDTTQQTFCNHE